MRTSLALGAVVGALFAAPAVASGSTGGAAYPDAVGGASYGAPSTSPPTVARFSVAARVREDHMPRVRYRVNEPGASGVRVRIAVLPLRASAAPLSVEIGRMSVGRTHNVHWPRATKLAPGRYLVRLHAVDDLGRTLVRVAHASGRATLTVLPKPRPKKRKPAPKPKPAPVPAPIPAPTPAAPVTATPPGPSAPAGAGVFPVVGSHTYGDGFGAPRAGYKHQGVDVLVAEGTQVVAPVARTVSSTAYQAGAAGYYVVLHAIDGRDMFFAHCQANSFAVGEGATVAAGAPLCRAGHTGDATGPHLHFEIWVGGWHVANGAPIDPLPQLKAWDAAA